MNNTIFETAVNGDYKFKGVTFDIFINERTLDTSGDILFDRCIFKEFVVLENFAARELSFFQCTFEKGLYVGKSNLHSISFFDCRTNDIDIVSNKADSLSFRALTCRRLEINGDYQSVQFVSSITEDVVVNDINNTHSYQEQTVSFLVDNIFKKLKIQSSISFSEIIFKGGKYGLVLFEGEFKKRISFTANMDIENLCFEASIFHNRVDFEEGVFDSISLSRSAFNGLVYFNDTNYNTIAPRNLKVKDLSIYSCYFDKNVSIQLTAIEFFSSSDCNYNEVLNLNNFNDYDTSTEKMVMIRLTDKNQGSIVIERVYCDITVAGINFGNISFKDSHIKSVCITDFQNLGFMSFSSVLSGEDFIITNSVTGKMNFLNTDINLFSKIVIANCDLDGANFKKYPEEILSFGAGYGIEEKKLRNANLKDVYNQFKRIARNKGDVDTANKFESLEHKQLLLSKKFGFDSILLFLNYISNNNGRSWFQGVLFTLGIGLLFFTLYLRTLGIQFRFDDCYQDYIKFISSFPKLELKEYGVLNEDWRTQLVLWLSRIFISYGIYQTIAAFRKYGKS